ncbi:P-loop containing nucleoside triphosphate hydrolase protein [Xylaria bambusicola]|uniref:P-loop containing nucleoside triphosphate hydrolase protein n=1 Tax=Xylaria bambusicola TaxID=326684 RepID=UPI0020081411|nr:P-loop containing nucleoside triphosphate hydrolase protein [Xylaria bambusicola]KAI0517988.1 P-loop containing nucleoside triphosphate hydrolase protein [Xylaria bambusicola]
MSGIESQDIIDARLPPDHCLPMIMVMGVTGAGKSYFINQMAGKNIVEEGASLNSCTQQCTMVPISVGSLKALVIDTPGFDDTDRKDADILGEIAKLLTSQFALGFELKGIIYIHRITDNRYAGSAIKTFEVFKRICGEKAMANVVLVTSRWDEVGEPVGASREHELRERFWAYMLGHGSGLNRYHGDRDSARAIASQLLLKDTVVLQIQDEIVNKGKNLDQTAAGSYVDDGVTKLKAQFEKDLRDLEELRRQLREGDRLMKLQVQSDMQIQRGKLTEVEKQQVSLKRDIVAEVEQEIKAKKSHWLSGAKKALPLLPVAVNLLLLFVGMPPVGGLVSVLTELFSSGS